MTGFYGNTTVKIDDKGRFNLPADHRKLLDDQAIVTVGPEDQLEIWPVKAFHDMLAEFDEKARENEAFRDVMRWVSKHAKIVGVDSQGRIALPIELRNLVGIDGASMISVLGSFRRIEIHPADKEQRLTKPAMKW
jgi:MraZ protein